MRTNWKNKTRREKQSVLVRILRFLTVGLSVLLLLGGITMISECYDTMDRGVSASIMENRLSWGNFDQLVEDYHINVAEKIKADQTMLEYYGVARYYEAASLYRAFAENGDQERAERELQKMKKAYEEMGSWQMAAEDIREQLGLANDKDLYYTD